jgi:hypothetical protein
MRSAIDRCCFAARFIHPLILCAELPLLTPLLPVKKVRVRPYYDPNEVVVLDSSSDSEA